MGQVMYSLYGINSGNPVRPDSLFLFTGTEFPIIFILNIIDYNSDTNIWRLETAENTI
jgi:hypothetical protein